MAIPGGGGPGKSRPARRRKARAPQPPSSTARQNAAFGSRPARPLPQPKPAPRPAARPVARPKPVRATRAAQQQYVSQGRAVEKAARTQKRQARVKAQVAQTGGDFDVSIRSGPHSDTAAQRTARKIGKPISVGADNHYYVKVKRPALPDRHIPIDPFSGKVDRKYQQSGRSQGGEMQQAAIQAPALKALDQTTRPVHGVMAATRAGIKSHGGGVKGLLKSQIAIQSPTSKAAKAQRHAFQRGIELKDRSLGSDVLKDIGVKNKAVAGAGGFLLDTLANPLTYPVGGTGSVAEKLAAKTASRVRRKALQHGLDQEVAERLAAVAAKRVTKAAPKGRGVTVKFAGQEVPGVRRATAKTARGARKLTRRIVGDKLATEIPAAARNIVREVAPRVRAPGVSHEQMATARSLARSGRSRVSESAGRADLLERDFIRSLKGEDKTRVVEAIERNKLSRIIGANKKAIDKLAKENPKEFKRRQALADKVHRARSEMAGEYRAGLRSGAIQKQRPTEYLTKGDLGKLDKTVAAEQAQQRRAAVRAGREETRAEHRAVLTEREAELRAQGETKVAQARATGSARVQQAQQSGRARVATEKARGAEKQRVAVEGEQGARQAQVATERVRGREARDVAVGRERALNEARRDLAAARANLNRHMGRKHRGSRVAAEADRHIADAVREGDRLTAEFNSINDLSRVPAKLWDAIARNTSLQRRLIEGRQRLEAAEQTYRGARGSRRPARMSAVRPKPEPVAPMSAVKPRVEAATVEAVAPKTARAGKAAERYERRAATTQLQQQRLAAAHSIPTRSLQETPEAYLRRVHAHAARHDLPLVKRRAETLLAKKPAQRARGYYPHITQEEIRTGEQSLLGKLSGREAATGQPRVAGGAVARTAKETRAGKRRVENRPLSVLNPEREAAGKAPYSTDVPVVVPNYIREVARSSQPAEFAQGIAAQVGRHLKPGEKLNQGEELYRLGFKGGKYGLHKEGDKTAAPAARTVKAGPTVRTETQAPRGGSGGQYVALPSNFFENIEGTLAGTTSKHNMKIIQGLDATQNLWKRGAITTLAFHVRNMIGDVAAGYNLPGVGGSLPKMLSALKVTRRASESHRFLRPRTKAERNMYERATLKPNQNSTIKVGGKDMALDDFIKLGVENGVPDTGRIARDILGGAGGEAKLHATAKGRSVTRPFRGQVGNRVNVWLTSRENVMRWAAFKHGLDRGMTPAEAADMASLYHIDYGEMSSFEREVLRRAAPFYTWTARSLPVAAKTAIQRPGKFANLEAAREETGQAFTGDTEQQMRDAMPDSVKRQVPVVIRVGNSNYAVSASLPVTLLNEFPDPQNPGKFLDEAWHFGFGMVGPYGTPVPGVGVKQLFELGMNKSAFTRRDIRPQYTAGRVPAPEWVGRMPDAFKKHVGAVQGPDKDTGKKIWYWDGRVDYGTRLLPGAAQQASQAAAGARPGQEKLPTAVGIASPVTGIRIDKLGEEAKTQAGRSRLAKELDKLNNRAELLNLQGIHSNNPTPEYTQVRARINAINKVLNPRKRKSGIGAGVDIGLGGGTGPKVDIGLGKSAGPKVDIGLGG